MTSLKYASGVISLSLSYEIETPSQSQERESTKRNKLFFLATLEKSRGMISVTCQNAHVSRATYYLWIKKDPVFENDVKEITDGKIFLLEDRMYLNAMNGDFKSQKYLLDRLHPEFKKKAKEEKESTVHIHHHADKKETNRRIWGIEDEFDTYERMDNNIIYEYDDGKPVEQYKVDQMKEKRAEDNSSSTQKPDKSV